MSELHNYALLLDKVSSKRLWSVGRAGDHTPVPIGDTLGCAGVWELLFDEAGNPRPVFEKLGWSGLYSIRLPMDAGLAARVAELLPTRAPADKLTESMLPMTEIQKRLVIRYIEPRND